MQPKRGMKSSGTRVDEIVALTNTVLTRPIKRAATTFKLATAVLGRISGRSSHGRPSVSSGGLALAYNDKDRIPETDAATQAVR